MAAIGYFSHSSNKNSSTAESGLNKFRCLTHIPTRAWRQTITLRTIEIEYDNPKEGYTFIGHIHYIVNRHTVQEGEEHGQGQHGQSNEPNKL